METSKPLIIAQTESQLGIEISAKEKADILASRVCYYYPCYTLAEARRLPARDCSVLLKTAMREQDMQYFELTQIAVAPHSKTGAKKLLSHYQSRITK